MKGIMGKFLTVTLAVLFSNFANAAYIYVNGWGIDTNGGGNSIQSTDTLVISGFSYTDTTTDGGGNPDTFTDTGYLSSIVGISDGSQFILNSTITAVFDDWSGSFSNFSAIENTADFDFTPGGTVTWYENSINALGSSILTAEIVNGTGTVDFDLVGTGSNSGKVNILFEVTIVDPGYIFIDLNGDDIFTANEDLSNIILTSDIYFGYADVTNSILVDPATGAYQTAFTNLSGLTAFDQADTTYDLITQNTGEYGMLQVVPEPAMLSLMGLAFLGLAGFQQRRKNA